MTVVVFTTNRRLAAMPGNVAIPADTAGLPTDSVVNVTSIATLDRNALEEHIGTLPAWLMQSVDEGLQRVLDLGRG